jgi:hypothetical protein
MSEQINVDRAFDPQARQAQAEFDAYLQTRPEDEFSLGVVNGANGPHPTLGSEYYDASRDNHYEATLEAGDYEKMSISTLAKELGQAELDEDPTRIGDIEDVLYAKMDNFVAKAGEKTGKQTAEDRTEAGNNLLLRVEKIKEGYKASVTGTTASTEAGKESPADLKKRAATTLEYNTDGAVKPGEVSDLSKKVEDLGRRAAAAKAAGNQAEEDKLGAEWKAASDQLNDLLAKVAEKAKKNESPTADEAATAEPAAAEADETGTDGTEATKSYEEMTDVEINELLRQLEQDLADHLDNRDPKYLSTLKEINKLRMYMEDAGIADFAELPPPPAAAEGAEEEEADDDSEPAKVGRIRRGWRNLRERAQHAAAGNTAAAFGRNKKPAAPVAAAPAGPIDPTAPFNPINAEPFDADAYIAEAAANDAERDNKKNTKLYLGAAVVSAAGIALAAFAAYKGHELMGAIDQAKEAQAMAMEAAARKAQNAQRAHEVALNHLGYYLKGLKAVEVQTGLKPGQPGFDEAVKTATDLAWKLEQAKS